eukprot:Hpha_TRINITY_DN476_c0_g1::TRINITY_DN476_c0_g1_i1::g.27769::m.27769
MVQQCSVELASLLRHHARVGDAHAEVLQRAHCLCVALCEVTEADEDSTHNTVVWHDTHMETLPGGAVVRRDRVGRQVVAQARRLVVREGEADALFCWRHRGWPVRGVTPRVKHGVTVNVDIGLAKFGRVDGSVARLHDSGHRHGKLCEHRRHGDQRVVVRGREQTRTFSKCRLLAIRLHQLPEVVTVREGLCEVLRVRPANVIQGAADLVHEPDAFADDALPRALDTRKHDEAPPVKVVFKRGCNTFRCVEHTLQRPSLPHTAHGDALLCASQLQCCETGLGGEVDGEHIRHRQPTPLPHLLRGVVKVVHGRRDPRRNGPYRQQQQQRSHRTTTMIPSHQKSTE